MDAKLQHLTDKVLQGEEINRQEATVPGELEQAVRIMDNVLRYLCVRQEA